MRNKGVLEPLKVKEQAIKTATELASLVLRIDDVISGTKPEEETGAGMEEY
jgi:chaperonin GroEL (HSP60 family)